MLRPFARAEYAGGEACDVAVLLDDVVPLHRAPTVHRLAGVVFGLLAYFCIGLEAGWPVLRLSLGGICMGGMAFGGFTDCRHTYALYGACRASGGYVVTTFHCPGQADSAQYAGLLDELQTAHYSELDTRRAIAIERLRSARTRLLAEKERAS